MRSKVCLVILLMLVAIAAPADRRAILTAKTGGGGAASPTYRVKQGFEGTGYDNGEGSNWLEGGTADEDFSTTGLSMVGSQCLKLDGTSADSESGFYQFVPAIAHPRSYFYFRITAMPSTIASVALYKNFPSIIASLSILPDGRFYVRSGTGTSQATVATVSPNTTYRVWFDNTASTGANDGIASVAFSTDGTKPTSGNFVATCTDGNNTSSADSFYLLADRDGVNVITYFDEARVDDDADIGSNPP